GPHRLDANGESFVPGAAIENADEADRDVAAAFAQHAVRTAVRAPRRHHDARQFGTRTAAAQQPAVLEERRLSDTNSDRRRGSFPDPNRESVVLARRRLAFRDLFDR